ncbi:MAG: porin family protein [Alphaproteobacteria bacterium]|nr:porin family protein [Alphaproteobacteria bacterium]MBV9371102.1 porin family protein [Alphaproteobacteria bacterium]MBV9901524.1 porin family protein [Alphaproteobacteria bacterium]
MRRGLLLAGTALLAFLPASRAPAQGFYGPYAGVEVGARRTGADVRTADRDRLSVAGGPLAGYDRQVARRVLLGGEAAVGPAAADRLGAPASAGRVSVDRGPSLDLTARAGYGLDRATLAYVRGGYTDARIEADASAAAEREYRDGWTLGAGIERHILERISARPEYRYADLGEEGGPSGRHRLLAGIAYRF